MHRAVVLLVLSSLAVATFGMTEAAREASLYIVGYDPDHADVAQLLILGAGGSIVRSSAELGFSVASTSDPSTFLTVLDANPLIDYVEPDDPTRLQGAQWNGAQWNGAQWNGGQWNGGQWNAGQWNAGQWNTASWSPAQRQAFNWTVQSYMDQGGGYDYDVNTSDPGLVWQWGQWSSGAAYVAEASPGAGTARLCVLDSGVAYDHPDLAPNMWTNDLGEHGINLIDPTLPPYDDAGHGTHIASIAAARVGNAFGVAGVANAQIMVVKVLDANGEGLEDQLAIGLAWCATNGADVAVMALGVTAPGPSLDRALQFAADRDVLMLASAGNAGPCTDCVGYPASDGRVIAVSAVDGKGLLANFSSAGSQVALAAPGEHVMGAFLDDGYAFGSGTSQAVAFAAGVAILVRDVAPTLDAGSAASILAQSATDQGATGRDPSFGHGLVNAEAAVEMALG